MVEKKNSKQPHPAAAPPAAEPVVAPKTNDYMPSLADAALGGSGNDDTNDPDD